MNTVAILPISDVNGEQYFRAIAGINRKIANSLSILPCGVQGAPHATLTTKHVLTDC